MHDLNNFLSPININSLNDGVRDQYLTDYYTGDNWYNKVFDIKFSKAKFQKLPDDLVNLEQRVGRVVEIINS